MPFLRTCGNEMLSSGRWTAGDRSYYEQRRRRAGQDELLQLSMYDIVVKSPKLMFTLYLHFVSAPVNPSDLHRAQHPSGLGRWIERDGQVKEDRTGKGLSVGNNFVLTTKRSFRLKFTGFCVQIYAIRKVSVWECDVKFDNKALGLRIGYVKMGQSLLNHLLQIDFEL